MRARYVFIHDSALDIATGIKEDVVRLQIPVDDALCVDMSQTSQRLSQDLQQTTILWRLAVHAERVTINM